MLNLLKKCLNTTNNNIIFIIPVIFIISGIITYINLVMNAVTTYEQEITAYIAFCVLISGCGSGILYAIRKSLTYTNKMFIYEKDRKEAVIYVFNSFFKGIGRTFLPILFITSIILTYTIIAKNIIVMLLPTVTPIVSYNILSYIAFLINACIAFWLIFWIPEII